MKEELDQLEKNIIWTFIQKDQFSLSHYPLSKKRVYKIKQDINRVIACFKAQ